MKIIGLLSLDQPRADLPALPRGALLAGGISLFERHVRQLKLSGAQHVLVVGQFAEPGFETAVSPTLARLVASGDVKILSSALDLVNLLDDDDTVILIEDGTLIDQRGMDFLEGTENAILVWPIYHKNAAQSVQLAPDISFAGGLRCKAAIVRHIARGLGDWDLEQTLVRAVLAAPDCAIIDLAAEKNIVWQHLWAQTDVGSGMTALQSAVSQNHSDWIEGYLYAPLAALVAPVLAPTAVMPDYLKAARWILNISAIASFILGYLWLGLALILIAAPLMCLANALADLRLDRNRFPRAMPILELMFYAAIVAALAFYFSTQYSAVGAWGLATITIGFAGAAFVQKRIETFFKRQQGSAIKSDDFGGLIPVIASAAKQSSLRTTLSGLPRRLAPRNDDSVSSYPALELHAAGANISAYILCAFGLFDRWYAGFAALSVYSIVLFFLAQYRFYKSLRDQATADLA
jgi:hypothetical protein